MDTQVQEPQNHPPFDNTQARRGGKSGWSIKKKVGVAAGSIGALAVSFIAGMEVGYNDAKQDIAAAFSDAFDGSFNGSAGSDSSYSTADGEQLPSEPVKLSVGDSVEVPCSMYALEEGDCMTLTLTDMNTTATCSDSYSPSGRYVTLTFEASMPADADSDFSSPFRSSPWSVATEDNQMTGTDEEVGCDLDRNHLDLMAEFPGYSATGTSWLPVPDNAAEVFFEVSHEPLFSIPLN